MYKPSKIAPPPFNPFAGRKTLLEVAQCKHFPIDCLLTYVNILKLLRTPHCGVSVFLFFLFGVFCKISKVSGLLLYYDRIANQIIVEV